MFKIVIKILIFVFLLNSCTSLKLKPEKRCQKILKNNYKNILVEKFESIVDNDTLLLNEVKFECVLTAMYIKKGMFDRFGKWHRKIYTKGENQPILLWENVRLFPNDTTKFTIAANGIENAKTIYASVLVFDKKNNDLLSENSKYKSKLIAYFSNLIRSNNSKKRYFYEIYWKAVNPKRWEFIKKL